MYYIIVYLGTAVLLMKPFYIQKQGCPSGHFIGCNFSKSHIFCALFVLGIFQALVKVTVMRHAICDDIHDLYMIPLLCILFCMDAGVMS